LDFWWFKETIYRHRHRASLPDAEQRGHKLRAIPKPEADAIPVPYAKLGLQLFGDELSLRPKLAIGKADISPRQRRFGKITLGRLGESECQIH